MAQASVRFDLGEWDWVADRASVGFVGHTDLGPVGFLITSEALAELLNPDLVGIDSELAIEIFVGCCQSNANRSLHDAVPSLNAIA